MLVTLGTVHASIEAGAASTSSSLCGTRGTSPGGIAFAPSQGISGLCGGLSYASTGAVTYHGGAVMHNATNYLIFWLPDGYSFDNPTIDPTAANSSNTNYERLMVSYFQDVGKSTFYRILLQYPDSAGSPGTSSSYGGNWIDTTPYPNGEGTQSAPLQDSDLQTEVSRAMSSNGWSANAGNSAFFVFTGYGVYSCADSGCSFGNNGYCAYHSAFGSVAEPVIYADMVDAGTSSSCLVSNFANQTPNADPFADSEINLLSHEEFEAVTDPYSYTDSSGYLHAGWYFQDANHEIGDECAWQFGTVAPDGSDLVIDGHKYMVQEEWSNSNGGCYLPPSSGSGIAPISLRYSVVGGASGFSAPMVTYQSDGQAMSATLGLGATTFEMDAGSTWTVTTSAPGSSPSERWQTNQPTTGIATAGQSIDLVYYHQLHVSIEYSVIGGVGRSGPPLIEYESDGVDLTSVASSNVWMDANTSCVYPLLLPGSTDSERWAILPSSLGSGAGVVTYSTTTSLSATYYHQYAIKEGALDIVGGGSTIPPTLSYTSFGGPASVPFEEAQGTQKVIAWADSGTEYRLPSALNGSSSLERWQSPTAIAQTASSSNLVNATYYHQFAVSIGYSLTGGGVAAIAPTASFSLFGSDVSARASSNSLTTASTQEIWADSGPYWLTDPLPGSNPSERWYAPQGHGTIDGPGELSVVYDHQYHIAIVGGTFPLLEWYDSGSTAVLNTSETYGRSGGIGQRTTSYSLDGRPDVPIPFQTSGDVSVTIRVDGPHTLAFNSVEQYEVSLDSTAVRDLKSITQPTINGDNYWYDSGTGVVVMLNGAWGRSQSSGSGFRLASFAINGGAQNVVAALGPVAVLNVSGISSPQTVSTVALTQFYLNSSSGSLESITPTQISGDAGWYDSGSSIQATYDYAWNETSNRSRLDAVSYDVTDLGQATTLPREGNGTFVVIAQMNESHQIQIDSIRQFRYSVPGGRGISTSLESPTRDWYYDSGSRLATTVPYFWNVVPNSSRDILTSYTLDDDTYNETLVKRISQDSGGLPLNITIPSITFDRSHSLTLDSVKQFFVAFEITDDSGKNSIGPGALQIQTPGMEQTAVAGTTGSSLWLDNGTSFTVNDIFWEGADVLASSDPLHSTQYRVDGTLGMPLLVKARVFDADLKVVDYLGLPVTGAEANINLANGSTISARTGSGGVVKIGDIPLGTFTGNVRNLGTNVYFIGDASTDTVTVAPPVNSYAVVETLGGLAILLSSFLAVMGIAKGRKNHRPPRVSPADGISNLP